MADRPARGKRNMDERVAIPLDPETALTGLMAVDPESVPATENRKAAKPRKKKPAKSK